MSDEAVIEITDIDDDLTISLDKPKASAPSTPRSVNFGPGVELLMNDKSKKESSAPKGDIDLGDLDTLESELNDLSQESKKSTKEMRSSLFSIPTGGGGPSSNEKIDIDDSPQDETPSIGRATSKIDDAENMGWIYQVQRHTVSTRYTCRTRTDQGRDIA